jgi:hypothetical protein
MSSATLVIHQAAESNSVINNELVDNDIVVQDKQISEAIGDFRDSSEMGSSEGFGSDVTSFQSPVSSLFDDAPVDEEEDFWA